MRRMPGRLRALERLRDLLAEAGECEGLVSYRECSRRFSS
jgi:hypothetical protein